MSLGTSIFLSVVLLSVVILFAATKDRWNWKRIAKWAVATPLVLAALIFGGAYLQDIWQSRLTPQTSFEGFSLAASPADVKFAKGEPHKVESDNQWTYYSDDKQAAYQVQFRDNKLRYVLYFATDNKYANPYLLNLSKGDTTEEVKERLGEPTKVDTTENGLIRTFSYDKYNAIYTLEKNRIVAYGIYDPSQGLLKFSRADSSN